ncbi:MAG TPA: hypothetical protein VMH85_18915 [Terriglobales bacterium]|nr:hypothetical protein [Terriglobales bacterium]
MGVQIYLLDRRTVTLIVGDLAQEIGALRRSWKVTEMDDERAKEMEAAKSQLQDKAAPLAAMVADVTELPLAADGRLVAAHPVLGWDADRFSVTDLGWDYLPVLGYAVHSSTAAGYVLHEEGEGGLSPITRSRALELEIQDQAGQLRRLGQPLIAECLSVRPYIAGYMQANCVLSDGRTAEILTRVQGQQLPGTGWYTGKRPSEVSHYPEATSDV